MPFNRPSLTDITNRVQAGVESRLSDEQMRRSDAAVYAREISGASHELYGYLDFIAAQIIYDTAESEFLDRWATLWLSHPRKLAANAAGNVLASGANGAVIEAGAIYTSRTGAEYVVTADATLAGGAAVVPVRAMVAGQAGNLAAGATLTLGQTIPGVASAAVVDGDGISGGADREDDVSLRTRLIDRIQQPPHGGSASDYVAWAKEVPGVTRAWVYPMELGTGSVTIRFMRDDDADPIPDAGEVEAVQAHIDSVRPVTVKLCAVVAPVPVPLDFTITLTPNTAAVRQAVAASLADLIRREAIPGGTLLISHIREAISLAAGETDHVLVDPVADIGRATGEISAMGAITWLP